jgi:hypothetical protein
MKKIDLLQVAILIIALLCAYSALESLLLLLVTIATDTDFREAGNGWSTLLAYLAQVLVSVAAMIILVRNSRRYATRLLAGSEAEPAADSATLKLDRHNLLFAVFVAMGLYTIIQALPYVIQHLFELFQNKVSSIPNSKIWSAKQYLLYELLRMTIGAVLIYGAANLTNLIERTVATRLKGKTQTR